MALRGAQQHAFDTAARRREVDVWAVGSQHRGFFLGTGISFCTSHPDVVLGLVSSKLPELESADVLRRRIDDAARYVPLDNLALSPQCGFASTSEGNLLTEEEQWRKLQLVVDVARTIWDDA